MAERMGGTVDTIHGSHVAFVSRPVETAAFVARSTVMSTPNARPLGAREPRHRAAQPRCSCRPQSSRLR